MANDISKIKTPDGVVHDLKDSRVPANAKFTDTNYYHTTGSWNGLTYTATANGGAGALALTLPTGTTSTTVARGDHTHSSIYNATTISGSQLDEFYETRTLEYALVSSTESTGLNGNDGMLLSLGWRKGSGSYAAQMIFDDTTAALVRVRGLQNNVWGDWKTVIHEGLLGSTLTISNNIVDVGNLNASKITAGTFDIARIPTGSTSTTVALGNHTHNNYVPFVGISMGTSPHLIRYNNLTQQYQGGVNNHYMVTIPSTTAWIEFSMELSLHDYNNSNLRYSKILITGLHNSASPYTLQKLTATVLGTSATNVTNLSAIAVHGKTDANGKIILYISGDSNYKTLSVDNLLVADGIIATDISDVTISTYTDLPSDVVAATMQYNFNPMTAANDLIIGGGNGRPERLAKGSKGTFLGINSSGNIAWETPQDTTYSAGTGLTLSGTQFLVTAANVSTMMNLLSEGTSPANRNDYAIVQYSGGGTTTTTYHRRKLAKVFAALNSSDITTALGYTPYNSTNPNGYTSNTGTVTRIVSGTGLIGGPITSSGTLSVHGLPESTALGGEKQPIYWDHENGFVAGTAIGASAYHADSYFALAGHTHSYLPLSGGALTGDVTLATGKTIRPAAATNACSLGTSSYKWNNAHINTLTIYENINLPFENGGILTYNPDSGLDIDTTAYATAAHKHGMTSANDMIIGGSGGTPKRLAKGSNNTFLGINSSGNIAWGTPGGTNTGHTHTLKITNASGTTITNLAPYTQYTLTVGNATMQFRTPYDTTCLSEGTKILMADNSEKNIEDVVAGDIIMSYDPNTEKLCEAVIIDNIPTGRSDDFVNYYFDDGSFLSIFGKHCIYSADEGTARGVDYWEPGWKTIAADGKEVMYIGSENVHNAGRKRHFDLHSSNKLYFANGILNAQSLTLDYPLYKDDGLPEEYITALKADFDSSANLHTHQFDKKTGSILAPILKELKAQKKVMDDNKKRLADSDYLVAKFTEGLISAAEWLKAKAERAGWRSAVNKAEPLYAAAEERYNAFKAKYAPTNTKRERFNAAVARDNACLDVLKAYYKSKNEVSK